MRVVLIYQFFGPYHLARWRHWRGFAARQGFETLGLQLFGKPDLYEWAGNAPDGVIDLALHPNGQDELRWKDAAVWLKALEQLRPEVVVVVGWGTRDAVLTHLWCRWRGIPRVLITDTHGLGLPRHPMKERIKGWLIRGIGGALVGGQSSRRYLASLGIQPDLTSDGCDVVDNRLYTVSRAHPVGAQRGLLTVSRLSPEKNLLAAGRAFMSFLRDRPPQESWSWSIAGYGPLESEVREMCRASGGQIRYLGAYPAPEVPRLYGQADLYWQPSLAETWGLAINEAMAAGLPVLVSSHCGCHEDLVHAENGWTFSPLEESSMISGLQRAAERHDQWRQMGEASSRLVAEWDLERFSRGLFNEVSRACGRLVHA